jgi:hypothetical protein
LSEWVPRLTPALSVALFHASIRVAHATRALEAADTAPRRAELARSLGYWGARFRYGSEVGAVAETADPTAEIVRLGALGARHYVGQPSIYYLHGVTGAMAAETLSRYVEPSMAQAVLAQVRVDHLALYGGAVPERPADRGVDETRLAEAAVASWDPHQVKLVEACRRGLLLSGDPSFRAAGERVTGLNTSEMR